MRPIDADVLVERYGEPCHSFLDVIEDMPTIDAVPVVHARWKNGRTCTACGGEAFYTEWTSPHWDYDWDENLVQMGEDHHFDYIPTPYCPNCGARMDGEAE